ncbi:MAG: LysR family transcriptional regulator [Myxococcaceae bacterium]
MELRHLRYFVAVAEDLNFTRAAARLHIAQPPLSQQIKALEDELGCELFERAGRSTLLTQNGRELLPEAKRILDGVEQLSERARQRARGEQGELRLALTSSFATPRFATMLRNFQRKHPGVRVSLGDHPSKWQLEALARGEIDVGFLRPGKRMPPNLATHVIRREPMRLAVPADHAFAKRRNLVWKELAGEPLILIDAGVATPDYYANFFERCRTNGFEPSVRQYTMNVATQVWLVSAGLGIAPMPNTPDVAHHSLGVSFIDLPRDVPVTETAIAWRKSDSAPALHRFVEFAREALTASGR